MIRSLRSLMAGDPTLPGAMSYVLAIDAGTTGVRAFALGDDGAPGGYAYREFPQYFPQPGWVEHDAEEIWATTEAVCADLADRLGPPRCIGITNQRETVVAWSRTTGRPLGRAIVWQDRRTADRCELLSAAGHLDVVRRRTGLVLDPYFSGTKIVWLLEEGGVDAGPDLAVGTVDAWLVAKLTGGAVHATEPSNASRTMLYDIRERRWSEELCDLLGVPLAALPEVRPSVGSFGETADGIPITGILGDQQAALFGQACLQPGMAKNTYGTGSFVLANVGPTCPEPVDGLLTTVAWDLGAAGGFAYALEGAIFVTGAAVQWLRDGLGLIEDAAAVEALAASVPDSAGLVLVPAFTGLGSPFWDPHARGTLLGITRGTGAGHLARATLEAMAFSTRDVVEAMAAAGGVPIRDLRVDGGATANGLLLQLVADQVQAPVTRPRIAETTALGAAYAAGLGAGVWSSPDEVTAAWRADVVVDPRATRGEADTAYSTWQRAVERARDWDS
jgi:glycerol kinase